MRAVVVRVAAESVLLALGVVLGHTVAWIVIGVCSAVLLGSLVTVGAVQRRMPFLTRLPFVSDRRAVPEPPQQPVDPAAFETTEGGETTVEGGSVTGYKRVSRAAGGLARFLNVKIKRR